MTTWEFLLTAFLTGVFGGLGGCIPLALLIYTADWVDRRRASRWPR